MNKYFFLVRHLPSQCTHLGGPCVFIIHYLMATKHCWLNPKIVLSSDTKACHVWLAMREVQSAASAPFLLYLLLSVIIIGYHLKRYSAARDQTEAKVWQVTLEALIRGRKRKGFIPRSSRMVDRRQEEKRTRERGKGSEREKKTTNNHKTILPIKKPTLQKTMV